MDFGFNLPTRGPLGTREAAEKMATHGEARGFTWFAVPDHIVIPRTIDSDYPYNEAQKMPGAELGDSFEQLTLMTWIAARTTRAKFVTSVMVVPHRNCVHTAKIISTLDVLSDGRVAVGCGAGWMREEFEALGAPDFDRRGRVTDEFLAAFKSLWCDENPEFHGEFVDFADVDFLPRPVQKPHPPLWIGGESPPALRRAARYGDAWFPIGANPRFPLNTIGRYRDGLEKLAAAAEKVGRDPASITRAYWSNWQPDGALPSSPPEGERHLFSGSDQALVDDVGRMRELGVAHLLFNVQRGSLTETLERIDWLADDILAKAGG